MLRDKYRLGTLIFLVSEFVFFVVLILAISLTTALR